MHVIVSVMGKRLRSTIFVMNISLLDRIFSGLDIDLMLFKFVFQREFTDLVTIVSSLHFTVKCL